MPYLYLDTLPNPNLPITSGGFSGAGEYGQPFKKVDLNFNTNIEISRSIYGRTNLKRSIYPTWDINITYNPMTKEQFSPVYNFIMQSGGFRPFWVRLPQYATPKDSLFAMQNHNDIVLSGNVSDTRISMIMGAWSSNDYSSTGLPSIGDMFNVKDNSDTQHSKAYIITGVDTYNDYIESRPSSGTINIRVAPSIQKNINFFTKPIVLNPAIKVKLASDIIQYSLDNNNLYEFGLKLKEVL